jgi:hypothetical protein
MNRWWRKPVIDRGAYVLRKDYGDLGGLEHLNDIPWDETPIPPWLHRCWPQTRMYSARCRDLEEKCGCGGVRLDGRGPWIDRNTRRPRTPEEQARADHSRRVDALIDAFWAAEQEGDGPRMKEIRDQVAALMGDS